MAQVSLLRASPAHAHSPNPQQALQRSRVALPGTPGSHHWACSSRSHRARNEMAAVCVGFTPRAKQQQRLAAPPGEMQKKCTMLSKGSARQAQQASKRAASPTHRREGRSHAEKAREAGRTSKKGAAPCPGRPRPSPSSWSGSWRRSGGEGTGGNRNQNQNQNRNQDLGGIRSTSEPGAWPSSRAGPEQAGAQANTRGIIPPAAPAPGRGPASHPSPPNHFIRPARPLNSSGERPTGCGRHSGLGAYWLR